MDNFPQECTDPIYNQIIENNILELSKDQFGNYVIQKILEKGVRSQDRKAICHSLLGNTRLLSIHKFSSNVVEKCIQFCEIEDKVAIIKELLGDEKEDSEEENQSIYQMMDNKYGNYVAQKAIEGALPEQRLAFYGKVKNSSTSPSNYVKHVINCLDRLNLDEGSPCPSNSGIVHTGQNY